MKDLREYLIRQRDWLATTPGRKHANVALSLKDLTAILNALEPRKLGPMEPRGTLLSQEQAAKMYEKLVSDSEKEHKNWVAILRAEA